MSSYDLYFTIPVDKYQYELWNIIISDYEPITTEF